MEFPETTGKNSNKPQIHGTIMTDCNICDCNWTAEFCDCSVWRKNCCLSACLIEGHSQRFGFSCDTFFQQCCMFIARTEACDSSDQPARCHTFSLYFKFYLDRAILWTQTQNLIFI